MSPDDACPLLPVPLSLPHSLQKSLKTALSAALSEEKEKSAAVQKEVEFNRTAFDCIMLTVQGLGAITQSSSGEEEEGASPRDKEQRGAVVVGGKDANLSKGKRPVWIAGSVS